MDFAIFFVDFLKASPVREALVLNTKLRICLKMYLRMIRLKSVLESQPSQGHVRHIYFPPSFLLPNPESSERFNRFCTDAILRIWWRVF